MTGLMNEISFYLDELFPNPRCELNYNKDYELLIAVMLSAQTTDKRVNMVTDKLFLRYPSLAALEGACLDDVAYIIRPIGTFNKKAKNVIEIARRLLNDCNGVVPNDRCYLEGLPGVGRKTANVVLSNLFGVSCIAVDTHVSRVSIRLGLAYEGDSPFVIEKKLCVFFDGMDLCRIHHQLVLFGRYYCKARSPKCDGCKFCRFCNYKKNSGV